MNYKKRIMLLDLSRRLIANRLGLSYNSLTARLLGYTPWGAGEELALNKILEQAEAIQKIEDENAIDPVSYFSTTRK